MKLIYLLEAAVIAFALFSIIMAGMMINKDRKNKQVTSAKKRLLAKERQMTEDLGKLRLQLNEANQRVSQLQSDEKIAKEQLNETRGELAKERKESQAKIEDLNQSKSTLEKKIKKLDDNRRKLEKNLGILDNKYVEVNNKYAEVDRELAGYQDLEDNRRKYLKEINLVVARGRRGWTYKFVRGGKILAQLPGASSYKSKDDAIRAACEFIGYEFDNN